MTTDTERLAELSKITRVTVDGQDYNVVPNNAIADFPANTVATIIYEDPVSRLRPEGLAIVIGRSELDKPRDLRCDVEFTDDMDDITGNVTSDPSGTHRVYKRESEPEVWARWVYIGSS